ncbi:MAG: isochorismatase family protein, partial [Candidatus Bathyarchaeia archaeon]
GSPLRPGTTGNEIKEIVAPSNEEPIITKTVNSAFIGTDLEAQLKGKNIETLVVVGMTTDHCVSTTARMAGNMGFEVYVVSDATPHSTVQDQTGNSTKLRKFTP